MIEDTIETKRHYAMATSAINIRYRMAIGRASCRHSVAGVASITHNLRTRVVGVGAEKTIRRMTEAAFHGSSRMRRAGGLADADCPVVTTRARLSNTRVIKTTVWPQFQKMVGIVAVIAFSGRGHMKFGFADGNYAVVAVAAIAKHFPMIDEGDNVKSQWRMTGRTGIAGGDMIQRFPRDTGKVVVVTILAA